MVKWIGGEGIRAAGPLFHHTIKLNGAKSPDNYFNIVVDPSMEGIQYGLLRKPLKVEVSM